MKAAIEKHIYQAMLREVEKLYPMEACGLIGEKNRIQTMYPIQNVSDSIGEFLMDPQQLIDALMDIRKQPASIRYLYHSHPAGSGAPSQTDLENDVFPGITNLIWSKEFGKWQCRAFRYESNLYSEIELQIFH